MANTIGYINGKNGEYPVYHNAPRDSSLYYRDSAGSSTSTRGFKVSSSGNGFTGPDGSHYASASSVLSAIQNKYNNGGI